MNDANRIRSSKGLLFGLFAIATGAVVLVGWLFDIPSLKSVLPGFVTMKANTAVGFVLAGLSLALLGCAARSVWVRQLSRVCACATALLGILTLSQYLFGMDFGIDQLLFREAAGAVGTLSLGRMAPMTAINFLLLGCALFLAGFRRTIPAAQRLVLVTGLMGMLPLAGYMYSATELFGIGTYTQMAVHTAVLFILLSLGVLLLHPTEGLMRTVTSDTVGGWLLRRLAPFVVGIPLVLGWLRVQGEQRGIFNGPFGVALMMMTMMLILTGLIWWTARALNRLDAVRQQEYKAREYAESIITEKKKLEREIMKARDTAEATNKELETFSYSVSHDLRAPLRGINGFSQALLEDYSDKLDATGKNYLERIRAGTQYMGSLIDDMLKLSRVIRAEFKRESVDLSKIVQAILLTVRKSNPARDVQVSIQKDIIIDGDRQLLEIALTNLIDNAWKFTGKTKKAHIEFGTLLTDGKPVMFIRDNGVGFDMLYVDKLFGVFQRLHTTDEFTGTGIGLATVQRVIHRHGGEIWAEAKIGKGATFYFTIPK
jgi:signal transduction histidine kinase